MFCFLSSPGLISYNRALAKLGGNTYNRRCFRYVRHRAEFENLRSERKIGIHQFIPCDILAGISRHPSHYGNQSGINLSFSVINGISCPDPGNKIDMLLDKGIGYFPCLVS